MPELPEPLVEMIRERITDPARRHYGGDDRQHGSTNDPTAISKFMNQGFEGHERVVDPMDLIRQQMEAWGQQMPEMFLSTGTDGNRRASSEPTDTPLTPPADERDLARLADRIGRAVPDDLARMFAIANGGWGPGYAFTQGHGAGLMSVDGVIAELDDLERRGPGYTGEMKWPANLLPITDLIGTTSYDLDTGRIVQFDDHWYDHDKAIVDAFETTHASLADFLQEWVCD